MIILDGLLAIALITWLGYGVACVVIGLCQLVVAAILMTGSMAIIVLCHVIEIVVKTIIFLRDRAE